jgi:hypothetical protein
MKSLKFTLLVPTLILLSFLMVVFAQHTDHSKTNHRLALEIGLNEPWTVNAAMEGNTLRAFVRVPADSQSPYSAIKLEPKMVGDKLEVTVTGLTGDTSTVKSCKDWAVLGQTPITSYVLKEGQEATVSQLSNLGSNFKNGMLSLKAVSFVAPPQDPVNGGGGGESTPCGCGKCNKLYCCPNRGECLGCGTCGDVCCGN